MPPRTHTEPTVHPAEQIHLHATGEEFSRVKVTRSSHGTEVPVVTFYGPSPEAATDMAKRHGYAVPDRLVYTTQRMTSRWQADVRYESNPPHVHEAVFYGLTEQVVRDRAEAWIQQQQEQPGA